MHSLVNGAQKRKRKEKNKRQCPFCRLIYCQNGSSKSIFTANENHLIRFGRPNEPKHNWSYDIYLKPFATLAIGTAAIPLHYTKFHNPFAIYEVWSLQWIKSKWKSKSYIGILFFGGEFFRKYAACHTYTFSISKCIWPCITTLNLCVLYCILCIFIHITINRTKDKSYSNKSYL